MKSKFAKIASAALTISLVGGSLAGCGSKEGVQRKQDTEVQSGKNAVSVYPLKNNPKLRIWGTNYSANIGSNYSDTEWAKEMEKKTGIKVEWMHPADTAKGDQLNLIFASGDLPDIIYNNWIGYAGGPERLLEEGNVIALNEPIEKFAPNFSKYIKTDAAIDRAIKTDSGKYYNIPMIRGLPEKDMSEFSPAYVGPIVRKDWLDDLGLKMPETIDDWYKMLKAFKDQKGAEAPLSIEKNVPYSNVAFVGSYGVFHGIYMDNGKVKYGPIQPEYKDFLTTISKWYKEGLLDQKYGKVDAKTLQAQMTVGLSGASFGLGLGNMSTWNAAMREKDPKFKVIPAPYPKLAKDTKTPVLGTKSSRVGLVNAAVTKAANAEVAMRFLDWAYSEDGQTLLNLGIEGESYTMVNGVATMTEKLSKSPEGATNARLRYAPINYPRLASKTLVNPMDKEESEVANMGVVWNTPAEKYLMPAVMPTVQEADELKDIMSEVNKYANSMYLKFVLGTEPIDNFDAFVAQLKKMGIERAIQINQAALDRYMKR